MGNEMKKRALNPEFLEDFLNGPLRPILDRVIKDDTLCMELRGSFVDIYYRGGTLYYIFDRGNHEYEVFYNENYDKSKSNAKKAALKKIPLEKAISEVPNRKEIMDFFFKKHRKLEREFQQLILRENNYSGEVTDATDYYILDIEYAFNGKNEDGDEIGARYDMLAVRWRSDKDIRKKKENLPISFIEVKYGDGAMSSDSDISKAGIHKHINDYIRFRKDRELIQFLAKDMAEVFNQKHKLGLISSYQDKKDKIEISLDERDVELLFALANHDPDKSKLLDEIKDTFVEWKGKDEEKYLDEIKVAQASLIGYGLYEFEGKKKKRNLTIREYYKEKRGIDL